MRLLLAIFWTVNLALSAHAQVTAPSRAGEEQRFRAEPQPLRFVVIGDYGTTDPQSFEVAALVRRLEPDLVITVGDNNYPDGEAATIDQNIGQHYHEFIQPYRGSYGAGALVNRFFPSLGNHDWRASGAQPYLDYFELPGNERYYDFRRGPVHFFALDSDPGEPDGFGPRSHQAAWLEERLASSNAPFKIVFLHLSPYDSGEDHGSQWKVQWPFGPWGASLVLSGHDHLYERSSVSGVPYVVNGLGGAEIDGRGQRIGGSQVFFNLTHGALLAEVDGGFAHFRFLTGGDSVQDDFVLPSGGVDPGLTELVAADAVWKYLDTGVDPGPSWNRAGFDDSGWESGRAQLGYGDGDETTVVDFGGDPSNRFITTWFRRSFLLARPEEFETLQLRMLHDDGAVVYVNGAEVARVGMPAGPIAPTTLATGSVSGLEENTFYPFTFGTESLVDLAPRQLSTGNNVLAVELHQASPSSNDLGFAAELVGLACGRMLLPRGSLWRYADGGAYPGAGWTESSYVDLNWSSGRAQLGFGEGDEATQVNSVPTTIYFRKRFLVDDAASMRWLSCHLLRDDGVILYLNGEEAARFNLPRTGVTNDTLASFNVGRAQEDYFETTTLDPRLLHDGINTIAVELRDSVASEDLSFDLELVAH